MSSTSIQQLSKNDITKAVEDMRDELARRRQAEVVAHGYNQRASQLDDIITASFRLSINPEALTLLHSLLFRETNVRTDVSLEAQPAL